MNGYRLTPTANEHLDQINDYTAERWGEDQAAAYMHALFTEFDRIAAREVLSTELAIHTVPQGYRRKLRSHVIYWRWADDGEIEIIAVLHGRMDQYARLTEALGGSGQAQPSST